MLVNSSAMLDISSRMTMVYPDEEQAHFQWAKTHSIVSCTAHTSHL
jgi:hypothetical protein